MKTPKTKHKRIIAFRVSPRMERALESESAKTRITKTKILEAALGQYLGLIQK